MLNEEIHHRPCMDSRQDLHIPNRQTNKMHVQRI